MSVELFQYDRDIYDDQARLLFSTPIVSQRIYNQYWEQARLELGLRYLQDGAQFDDTKKDIVIQEIYLLLDWVEQNVQGTDLQYMKNRLEHLLQVIPELWNTTNAMVYIF